MTYDDLVKLTGHYPIITTDQWDAMNTDERLVWLAKAVNKRDENWKKTLVMCNAAWEAKLKTTPIAAETPSPSWLSIVAVAVAVVSFLLSLGMWAVSR